ncbi:hypothetical protein BC937DRAFT_94579 [Endogone sp. FLAS-F59071]|nr:hypothetical protein BC937DRAFT_94579 [Endogone sp. FLAS-F59071]|eukprot:RUS20697.1 hypothetical protein BC937DRAFT_94579 [Endogone sp. FLAS-F59071]
MHVGCIIASSRPCAVCVPGRMVSSRIPLKFQKDCPPNALLHSPNQPSPPYLSPKHTSTPPSTISSALLINNMAARQPASQNTGKTYQFKLVLLEKAPLVSLVYCWNCVGEQLNHSGSGLSEIEERRSYQPVQRLDI